MQTFLPFPDFKESAKALDDSRLGKQRIETKQLLTGIYFESLKGNIFIAEQVLENILILNNKTYGWANHPAMLMWNDYPFALIAYGLVICEEWKSRGNQDNTGTRIEAFASFNDKLWPEQYWLKDRNLLPPWIGDERLHRSHRSNLIRKNETIYRHNKGWTEPNDLPYFWPVTKEHDYEPDTSTDRSA